MTTRYPVVKFMSAPSATATVRFDCNAAGQWSNEDIWEEHDGFTLGFPTLAGDPEAIGVQYGTRQIEFNLIVRAKPDAAFNAFMQLSREVQRPRNWLMVKFSPASPPVWFHTYRTEQQALDFQNVIGVDDTKSNQWGLGVRLAADPFGQGERITLPTYSIGNNSAATNPWHVTLPDIAGDAPAPARIRVRTSTDWSGFTPMFSSIALDGGSYDGAPVVFSMENAAAATDTGAWTTSTFCPTGGDRPISFATSSSLKSRVSDNSTLLPIGTYNVYVWVRRENTVGKYQLRGRHALGGALAVGDTVAFDRDVSPGQFHGTWVPLGLFTFPFGAAMDDQDVAYAQTAQFTVEAARTSGTGDLRIGALLYVPTETPWSTEARTCYTEFGSVGLSITNRTGEWDEDGNYRMLITSSLPTRSLYDTDSPRLTGGLPLLVPGCTNTLSLIQQTNCHTPELATEDNRDVVTATASVTLSYAPRYLHLAASELL